MISSSVSSSSSQTDQATSPTSKILDSWEEVFVVDCTTYFVEFVIFSLNIFEVLQWLIDQCRVAALVSLIQARQVMIGW